VIGKSGDHGGLILDEKDHKFAEKLSFIKIRLTS
jgi:hypothetical protein